MLQLLCCAKYAAQVVLCTLLAVIVNCETTVCAALHKLYILARVVLLCACKCNALHLRCYCALFAACVLCSSLCVHSVLY